MLQPPVLTSLMRGLEMRMDKLWALLQGQRALLVKREIVKRETHLFLSLTQQITQIVSEISNHWGICVQWRSALASTLEPLTERRWQHIRQLLQQARCYQRDTRSLLIEHLDLLQQRIDNLLLPPYSSTFRPEESEAVMVNTQV